MLLTLIELKVFNGIFQIHSGHNALIMKDLKSFVKNHENDKVYLDL